MLTPVARRRRAQRHRLLDQACAKDRRNVSTVEQHVHSLLEISPLTAALLLTALHWGCPAGPAATGP